MIAFTNLTGLGSVVILIATAAMLVLHQLRIPRPYLALLTIFVAVIVCVPIPLDGLPPAAYLRGVTGDLSVTSVLLLALTLLKYLTGWHPFQNAQRIFLWGLIVFAAVVLYPSTLGTGNLDPYRMGFGNACFLVALFVIALAAYWKKFYVIALCIALAVFAWSVGWNEANNMWNYLLDPFVVIYATGALISGLVRALMKLRARQKNL